MPAKLELLPRKCFSLTLTDGTVVNGQFGTWALSRFGQKKKLSLPKVIELFEEPQTMDIIEFVLCAIEYKERQSKQPLFMDDLKLCAWIDDYAAETGETGILIKLWAHANSTDAPDIPESEKKTEDSLDGVSSSKLSLQPVEA
jgi:hypothetical protein